MTKNLEGQVALITGAGSGIGRSIALHVASAGASVALFGRDQAKLERVAADIHTAGGRVVTIAGDVTRKEDVVRAVSAVETSFGPVTYLVNNAGRSQPYGPIGTVDPEGWWQTQAIHVFGPMLFMSAVIPSMRERGAGRILNIASIAGTMVAPGSSAYCVSKSTIIRLSEHAAAENRDSELAIFVVHPGSILTDMVKTGMSDPDAPRRPIDPTMGDRVAGDLERVGSQAVALASGEYDELAGSLLNLEIPLEDSLAQARREPLS